MDANKGIWKKPLGYDEPKKIKIKVKDTNEKKVLKKESGEYYKRFFNKQFPVAFRRRLVDSSIPIRERIKELYKYLIEKRDHLKKSQKELKSISKMIVDLIHTIKYHDTDIIEALKSNDGLKRLNAFKTTLKERDRFAIELGYIGGFEQVLNDLGISSPTVETDF